MNEERPSQTAAMVAFLRALGDAGVTSVPHFADPTARKMLPLPWSLALRAAERRARRMPLARRRRIEMGTDLLVLRTVLIDEALRDALRRGTRQVVILGAGLDGRAFRIAELEQARVFEIDHPATQAYKRPRVRALTPTALEVRFVGVNFERDDLGAALEASGHDAHAPSFFIWEGVLMYLTDDAVRATLRVVSERAAPGSEIIMTYGTPARSSLLRRAVLRAWREPQIGRRSREHMARLIAEARLVVEEDSGLADWATRFGAGAQDPRRCSEHRAVLARA